MILAIVELKKKVITIPAREHVQPGGGGGGGREGRDLLEKVTDNF